MTDHVILVDTNDNAVGTMEKLQAHQEGVLHRAFSVLLFNSSGELLLQQRAFDKYHSGGLWTNTCCSHPLPGEDTIQASRRRLMEEMGIDMQPEFAYKFIYKTPLDQNLIEHELDHVFIGKFDGAPRINEREVADWKFTSMNWLREDVLKNPNNYTTWFRLILEHKNLQLAGV